MWLVELCEAKICRHHCPVLVEFVNPGMLFEEGHYPVHQMIKHTMVDGMTIVQYDNIHLGDAFHIPQNAFEVLTARSSRYCPAFRLSI